MAFNIICFPNVLGNKTFQKTWNQAFEFEKCADKWLSMLNDYEKRLTCKAYWVIVVLCWNLFCSCLVLFLFLSSPICHFPISCLMTAGSSSIITFTELSANVRGNSILLNHRESGLEKLQNVQKLARWFTALKYCWGVLFEHALPLHCRIIIEMRCDIYMDDIHLNL